MSATCSHTIAAGAVGLWAGNRPAEGLADACAIPLLGRPPVHSLEWPVGSWRRADGTA
jgi:hypothetical protein